MLAQAVRRWRPNSRLFLVGEGAEWSIDRDIEELAAIARRLGIPTPSRRLLAASRGQCVFYGSQFSLLRREWTPPPHRLATAYFHGLPGTPEAPEFDACFEALRGHHEAVARIQVSHSQMHELVLESGIAPSKVFRIPIGVDLQLFPVRTDEDRRRARARFAIPESAFVVGSFVKDGVGWGEGLEPKPIKGPDVLVDALELARRTVPELFVLLSGPARGYVKRELARRGIPYRHVMAKHREIPELYRAADACLIASRQEGGPKALLEAMASGVPVVTTRVGQAMDLVRDLENAIMVDVGDAEGLAAGLRQVAAGADDALLAAGRRTAEANAYAAQLPLWRAFFSGFVATS